MACGYFLHLLLLRHGDTESNPGQGVSEPLKPFHLATGMSIVYYLTTWLRFPKLKFTNSLFNHEFICISETYFDSSVIEGDRNFQLNGYNLLRADHPNNTKQRGACIYYKESLCAREVKLSNLSQYIIYEVSLRNCKGYICIVYRSPIQDNSKFENFLSDSEELSSKTASLSSLFSLILGDFNTRSSSCWKKDKTTAEGIHVETLTSLYNFHQLISEPTHLLPQSNSCIDLVFTDQPNLAVNCGRHVSLNSKCHHEITHCKFNLSIEYPPPYEWLVWDYRKADIESIQKSVKSVNWETLFNTKTVNKQVSIFNKTIINIYSNFAPNKLVTYDDSNSPWMNKFIKNQIKWKHQISKYIRLA